MSSWLNRHGAGITSAPTTAFPQPTPTNSFPFQPRQPRIKDPNAPDTRLQIAQKCIYERHLPGGAYITAHVLRQQSGFYDSPVIHGDCIDNVRFLAINFTFHPLHTSTRFKSAKISIALHDDTELIYSDPKAAPAGFQKPPVPKRKPRFLRFAPHILYGGISPETLDWNFNLAGSLGTSQAPVSASISPSGGMKGTYKLYEMMRLQGSLRTLRSWHHHEYDIEDGEVIWTLEENRLQHSGLPREMTFVMLVAKGDVDRVVFDIDIDAVITSWYGHYPLWWTNTPKYRPFTKNSVNLDQEMGQKFEPTVTGKGFNFANLAGTFDDFVSMPGTTYTTSDAPPVEAPKDDKAQAKDQSSNQSTKPSEPWNVNVFLNHGQSSANSLGNRNGSNPALQQLAQQLQNMPNLAYRSKSPALPAPPNPKTTEATRDVEQEPPQIVRHSSTFPRTHARHTAGLKADAMNGVHVAKAMPSPIQEHPSPHRGSIVSNPEVRRASSTSQTRPSPNLNGTLQSLQMPKSRSRSPISQNSSQATKVRVPQAYGVLTSEQDSAPKKQRSIDIAYSDRSASPHMHTNPVIISNSANGLALHVPNTTSYQNGRQISSESRYSEPSQAQSHARSVPSQVDSSPLSVNSNVKTADQNGRARRSSLRRSRSKSDLRKSVTSTGTVSSEEYGYSDPKNYDWKRHSLQSAVSPQSSSSYRNSVGTRNVSGTTGSSGPNWEAYESKKDGNYEPQYIYSDSDSVDEYERMGKELKRKDMLNARGQLKEQVHKLHYRGVPVTAQRTYV